MRAENRAHRIRELSVRGGSRSRSGVDEVSPPRLEQCGVLAHSGTEPTPHAVADHRIADRPTDRERNPRWLRARRENRRAHLERSRSTTTPMGDRPEHCAVTNAPDQAERLERPLPRRRPMTARPPRVRIRIRKPCVFFRFRLFGWNVLFTHGLLERPGRGGGPGASALQDLTSARASGQGSVRPTRAPGNARAGWQRFLVGLSTAR
jgi:hypothetical protein